MEEKKKNYVIETTGIDYSYSKKEKILFDINLKVEKGSIYGFLGPNGSGKTTTLSLLLGLLRNQEGKIEIFGKDLSFNRNETLKNIGSLIESPSLYAHLTARENLEVYRGIYGASKERINEVLKMVNLVNTKNKTVKKFSLGMKQRLSIAVALLPNPQLLILDEPANGLDPAGMIELRDLLKKLNKEEGMTIIVSSHILSEIERMVTHVGIIFEGKMMFQGSLQELNVVQKKQLQLHINTSNNRAAIEILRAYEIGEHPDYVTVSFKDKDQIAEINRLLLKNNLDVYLLHPKEKNLEQLFIDLTSSSYEHS